MEGVYCFRLNAQIYGSISYKFDPHHQRNTHAPLGAMARSRAIETRLERLVPSLDEFFVLGFKTQADIRGIVRERTTHEYKLVARPLLLTDVRRAIEFELDLDQALGEYLRDNKLQAKHRWTCLDRAQKIFEIAVAKLDDAEEREAVIADYVAFLKQFSRTHELSRFFAKQVQLLPTNAPMWVAAIDWEIEGARFDTARSLAQRALTLLSHDVRIWSATLNVEVCFIQSSLASLMASNEPSPVSTDHAAADEAKRTSYQLFAAQLRVRDPELASVLLDAELALTVAQCAFDSAAASAALLKAFRAVVLPANSETARRHSVAAAQQHSRACFIPALWSAIAAVASTALSGKLSTMFTKAFGTGSAKQRAAPQLGSPTLDQQQAVTMFRDALTAADAQLTSTRDASLSLRPGPRDASPDGSSPYHAEDGQKWLEASRAWAVDAMGSEEAQRVASLWEAARRFVEDGRQTTEAPGSSADAAGVNHFDQVARSILDSARLCLTSRSVFQALVASFAAREATAATAATWTEQLQRALTDWLSRDALRSEDDGEDDTDAASTTSLRHLPVTIRNVTRRLLDPQAASALVLSADNNAQISALVVATAALVAVVRAGAAKTRGDLVGAKRPRSKADNVAAATKIGMTVEDATELSSRAPSLAAHFADLMHPEVLFTVVRAAPRVESGQSSGGNRCRPESSAATRGELLITAGVKLLLLLASGTPLLPPTAPWTVAAVAAAIANAPSVADLCDACVTEKSPEASFTYERSASFHFVSAASALLHRALGAVPLLASSVEVLKDIALPLALTLEKAKGAPRPASSRAVIDILERLLAIPRVAQNDWATWKQYVDFLRDHGNFLEAQRTATRATRQLLNPQPFLYHSSVGR